MVPGRRCGSGIAATQPTAPGTAYSRTSSPRPMQWATLTGTCQSTRRSTVLISTVRTCRALIRTQGALSNYKNLPLCEIEPAGHGIGRSRGGLSTKVHFAVEGHGRPLSIVVTGGQRHDGALLQEVLGDIRVPRIGCGQARTRPDALLADRGYTSRVNRAYLRERGIAAVIPEKSNEIAARKRKGRAGGRPPGFDAELYKDRNVVERAFGLMKQWRGLATRYDKLAVTYRAGVVLAAILVWLRI